MVTVTRQKLSKWSGHKFLDGLGAAAWASVAAAAARPGRHATQHMPGQIMIMITVTVFKLSFQLSPSPLAGSVPGAAANFAAQAKAWVGVLSGGTSASRGPPCRVFSSSLQLCCSQWHSG